MLAVKISGCRLELKFSCFALLAFCCLFAGVSGGAASFLAVALHESAHLAALFLFRAPPERATVSALGCRIVLDPRRPLTPAQSAAVSLAGPLANLLSFLVLLIFGLGERPFAWVSLGLGVFHLLPVEPLDGGLALRSLLAVRLGEERAGQVAFGLSLALLLPLAVLGFLILLRTRYNFTLLAVSVYLMLYLVLKRDFFA